VSLLSCGCTFGTAVKVLRTGYRPLASLCFLRLYEHGDGFQAQLMPFTATAKDKWHPGGSGEPFAWWTADDEVVAYRLAQVVREVCKGPCTEPTILCLDEQGNLVPKE